jgi:hypothetical protein
MIHKQLICHDFDACRELIEQHASALGENAEGLDRFAAPRTVIPHFAGEAMERRAVVLARIDPGCV